MAAPKKLLAITDWETGKILEFHLVIPPAFYGELAAIANERRVGVFDLLRDYITMGLYVDRHRDEDWGEEEEDEG